MVYAAISDVSKEGIYFGQNGELEGSHQGIFRPGSGDPAFLSKPSDLAPEVIGFGLIPADDPNGPSYARRTTSISARRRSGVSKPFHLQRTRFEMIAERKLGVAH